MLRLPQCASSCLNSVHVQVRHAHPQGGCQRVSQKVMDRFNYFASLKHVPGAPGTLCTRNVDSILLEICHTKPTLVMQIPNHCVPVASALIGVLHASTECQIAFSRLRVQSPCRCAIICLEDSILHPALPIIVWCMAAQSKGFALGRAVITKCLAVLYHLAHSPIKDTLILVRSRKPKSSSFVHCSWLES